MSGMFAISNGNYSLTPSGIEENMIWNFPLGFNLESGSVFAVGLSLNVGDWTTFYPLKNVS